MATSFISSKQWDDAVLRGSVKRAFYATKEENKPYFDMLGFEEDTTQDPFDEFTSRSGIGLARRKEEGGQVKIDVPKQNYTIRVNQVAYAIMVPISEEAIRFMKRGRVKPKNFFKPTEDVAISMTQTQDVLAHDIFGNAFDSTFSQSQGDGQPLISTTHKLGKGGTASNHLGAAGFSQTSLEAACIQADRFPDEGGLPIGVKRGKRLIVMPPEYRFEAKEILTSTQRSDTANNATNAIKDEGFEIAVSPLLPSATNWFVVNTGEKEGLYYIAETPPKMRDFGDDKVHVMYFQGYMMIAFAFGLNWRRVQGSNV